MTTLVLLDPDYKDYVGRRTDYAHDTAPCTQHELCRTVPVRRYYIWARDEGMCRIRSEWCRGPRLRYVDMTLDHIVPGVRGGETCWYNVQTACSPCNVWKGNKEVVPR